MKHDYTNFDAALIEAIKSGKKHMASLEDALAKFTHPFREKDRWGSLTPEFRIIDRRLQALRKAGRIKFMGKIEGWRVL